MHQMQMRTPREDLWLGFGAYDISQVTSLDEALRMSGLDWEVGKRPLLVQHEDGRLGEVPGRRASVRLDTRNVLGVVSDRYNPLQNQDVFRFASALTAESPYEFDAAGSTHGGDQVFLNFRLDHDVHIVGEPFQANLMFYTSHSGGSSLKVMQTPVRLRCTNALSAAVGNATDHWSLRHSSHADLGEQAIIDEVQEVLRIDDEYLGEFNRAAQSMQRQEVRLGDGRALLRVLLPGEGEDDSIMPVTSRAEEKRDEVYNLWRTSPNIGEANRDTEWGFFNAVSEWSEHVQPRDASSRFNTTLRGHGRRLRDATMEAFGWAA